MVASSNNTSDVFSLAYKTQNHAFVIWRGKEQDGIRICKQYFTCDSKYLSHALPVVSIEVRALSGKPGFVIDRVIPDTGSEVTSLPLADCLAIGLNDSNGVPRTVFGVGGSAAFGFSFDAFVAIEGAEYSCSLQVDVTGDERLHGRDVMNSMRVLFDGPDQAVTFNA